MNKQTILTVRIDKVTKAKAQKVLKKLGLNFSSSIRLFLNQMVITGSIPFDIKEK